MRSRNILIMMTSFIVILLALFSSQGSTRRSSAATEAPTTAGTPQDVTAMCEELRTIPNATPEAQPTVEGTEAAPAEIARPSNPGGPGDALKLTGEPKAGEKIYVDNCQKCHGDQGQGDVKNPGSDDVSIPALNPIDETLIDTDPKVFACNIDLFVEHGSVPAGPNPQQTMPAWGDEHKLTSQQMADVESYVISLNGGASGGATPAATAAK